MMAHFITESSENVRHAKERFELKIKRGEVAKEFPMMKVAKYGDVGIDIPVALPLKDGWEEKLNAYINECTEHNIIQSDEVIKAIKHGHIIVNPGCRVLIPTDIRIEVPYTHWAAIEARSSTSKRSLIVPKGVIDPGYRGELFAQIINVGEDPAIISHGDRLIQMILHENVVNDFDITEVDELTDSERGESGFGSTGQSAI